MGNNLFGVDIASIVNQAIAPGLLDAVLIKTIVGGYDSNDYTAGPSLTTANYTAKGIIENYQQDQIDGTDIKKDDKKILLIGNSIQSNQVPETDDKITIEGHTYAVVSVPERDPAAATYICQVR